VLVVAVLVVAVHVVHGAPARREGATGVQAAAIRKGRACAGWLRTTSVYTPQGRSRRKNRMKKGRKRKRKGSGGETYPYPARKRRIRTCCDGQGHRIAVGACWLTDWTFERVISLGNTMVQGTHNTRYLGAQPEIQVAPATRCGFASAQNRCGYDALGRSRLFRSTRVTAARRPSDAVIGTDAFLPRAFQHPPPCQVRTLACRRDRWVSGCLYNPRRKIK
jgi:hypothetical protein